MSGSLLKLIACIAMLLDHVGAFIPSNILGTNEALFCLGGKDITFQYLLRAIGRSAFPIFAFLISEGFVHTSNRKKYALNLLCFALISEIPFNLACSNSIFCAKQNVYFTLLFGFLGICLFDSYRQTRNKRQLYFIVGLFLLTVIFRADYGCFGYGFIILMYILRRNKIIMAIIGSCVLPSRWIGGVAFLPICMYNGKRGFIVGKVAKYGFYLFYPVHLLMLYMVRFLCNS